MTSESDDLALETLRRVPVLEPDPARSTRVRQRCRAAFAGRRQQGERSGASRPSAAVRLEAGLMYGLSVGYLFALIGDLLRIYMRR